MAGLAHDLLYRGSAPGARENGGGRFIPPLGGQSQCRSTSRSVPSEIPRFE